MTKTSLVPAEKLTKEPALLDDNTVSRDSVVVADSVPMPTSHSEPAVMV